MRLIDHRLAPGRTRWHVVFPVKRLINDHAFGRNSRVIMRVGNIKTAVEEIMIDSIAVDTAGAGVDQQFGRIEAVARSRIPRAVHPEAIAYAGTRLLQKTVPDVASAGRQVVTLFILLIVKDAELNPLCVCREEREIHAVAFIMRAKWRRLACRQLRHSPSLTSQMVESGGSVRQSELSRPWLGIASLCTVP